MTSEFHAFSLGCVAAALAWPTQASVVKLDFEAIGLAAPSTGTAVLDTFKANYGLSFSENAFAFHNGGANTDEQMQIPKPPGGFGYVHGRIDGAGDFTSFTISIIGKNYVNFSLNIGAPQQPSQILAYDAQGNILNTSPRSDFSNTNGWEWTKTPFELVGIGNNTAIDHISFISGRSGFAVDDLQFTEAGTGGGGGKVPEPAGLGLVALALAAAGVASRRGKPA